MPIFCRPLTSLVGCVCLSLLIVGLEFDRIDLVCGWRVVRNSVLAEMDKPNPSLVYSISRHIAQVVNDRHYSRYRIRT